MDEPVINVSKEVESLATKAEQAKTSLEALQYSQAASNIANAMACVNQIQKRA